MRARLRVTSVLAMIAQHVAQDPNPLDASLMHGFEFELAHSISLAGDARVCRVHAIPRANGRGLHEFAI